MPILGVPNASAQKPAKAAPKPAGLDLKKLEKQLESGDQAQVLAALQEIQTANDPKAAALVEVLLTRGTSATALLKAIEVAASLGQASSSRALAAYVQHRSPEVRRAAAKALLNTKGAPAVVALRNALRSNDAVLRGIAASALGALGAKEAVSDLFLVLSREVPEAASSIGELCALPECEKFVGLIGKLPFDVMQSGLEPMFFRSAEEVPDDFKINLIERIRKLQTETASELLNNVASRFPADGSPKVKAALQAAVRSRVRAPATKQEPKQGTK
jgi:HEAT repeat protein